MTTGTQTTQTSSWLKPLGARHTTAESLAAQLHEYAAAIAQLGDIDLGDADLNLSIHVAGQNNRARCAAVEQLASALRLGRPQLEQRSSGWWSYTTVGITPAYVFTNAVTEQEYLEARAAAGVDEPDSATGPDETVEVAEAMLEQRESESDTDARRAARIAPTPSHLAPLPASLTGCGCPAELRFELYAPVNGQLHGSLSGTIHVCGDCLATVRQVVNDHHLTMFRVALPAPDLACGSGYDFVRMLRLPWPPMPGHDPAPTSGPSADASTDTPQRDGGWDRDLAPAQTTLDPADFDGFDPSTVAANSGRAA